MFFPKKVFRDLGVYALVISTMNIISKSTGYFDMSPIYFGNLGQMYWDIFLFFIGYVGAAYILNYFNLWKE